MKDFISLFRFLGRVAWTISLLICAAGAIISFFGAILLIPFPNSESLLNVIHCGLCFVLVPFMVIFTYWFFLAIFHLVSYAFESWR